jgi:hypothetical protein
MACPEEILWPYLDQMALRIDDQGMKPNDAARLVASHESARSILREWNPVTHSYRQQPIQRASLARRLKRQWAKHGDDVRQRLKERAQQPWSAEATLWGYFRQSPDSPIAADTLAAILRHRAIIRDPLLDAIAELVARAISSALNSQSDKTL